MLPLDAHLPVLQRSCWVEARQLAPLRRGRSASLRLLCGRLRLLGLLRRQLPLRGDNRFSVLYTLSVALTASLMTRMPMIWACCSDGQHQDTNNLFAYASRSSLALLQLAHGDKTRLRASARARR